MSYAIAIFAIIAALDSKGAGEKDLVLMMKATHVEWKSWYATNLDASPLLFSFTCLCVYSSEFSSSHQIVNSTNQMVFDNGGERLTAELLTERHTVRHFVVHPSPLAMTTSIV